jgi:hypothetical protein
MEANLTNLYKVYMKNWNSPAFVAADSQQEAIDKVAEDYATENKYHFTVEYVSDVYV